ncbi:MAG: trypsin-like peptidase domain-containing protein [Deltaproteobacteria bacterium]|nr:trypsin-like peptidase domain-containing protein [Deltaproteobacteria bacterium]
MRQLLSGLLGLLLAAPATAQPAQPASSAAWERVLERVVPAVVVLRVSETRPFDTEATGTATATGFVVDAEQGIILTNRHVVSPGPVVAEAVFQNHEEVDVRAVYRDPVHDFGFFRYDPSRVHFMRRAQLELAPDQVRVGAEVRVVGNDAGEKLSILAGTLARLDRAAPHYGPGRYSDFNTFYFQAASNTSGGSSGSPVVDQDGRVVALNAGGKQRAASSYYLPLDRVVRALELVRRGEPVPRGTLQAIFEHQPYDEVRRLGLRPDTEGEVRRAHPGAIGMLVVGQVIPDGPADGALEPGDVLVRVAGALVTGFLPLESALDQRVGGTLDLEVERGGEPHRLQLEVGDLHAITPDSYLEVGGAVLNPFSYQQARNYGLPVRGAYLAHGGYMFRRAGIPSRSLITRVGGTDTPTLDVLEEALAGLPDGARVPVRFRRAQMARNEEVRVVRVDRRWNGMRRCTRDDASGNWPCVDLPPPPPPEAAPPSTTSFRSGGDSRTRKVARSLAVVRFHVPFRVDGVSGDSYLGAGVVIDAERGLVLTDRDTVPVALGDATLTFAGSIEVPAQLAYIHPEHNLAVLRYDPALLGETPVRSASVHARELEPGDDLWLVALTPSLQLVSEKARVSQVEVASLPTPSPPRFRETNVELVALSRAPKSVGGALVDRWGRVVALWSSFAAPGSDGPRAFFAGIPSELLLDVITPLREGRLPEWRTIGAELRPLSLADARTRGLSEEAARILEDHDPQRRRVLDVARVAADVRASEILEEGDLLLAIDGTPVTRVREMERAVASRPEVELALLRDGEEITVRVPTDPLDGNGTQRALLWAGALLQVPHRAVAAQRGLPREGLYVSWYAWGSPAHRYGLGATRRIVAADGKPTPDLDAFLAAVGERRDRDSVRLRTLNLEGRTDVITLKLDLRYWPPAELRHGPDGWERIER